MPESDLKPDQSKAVAAKSPQSPLFKADKATLAIAAQRDGSLRVTYAGWDDARVILGGESLELVWAEGQVWGFRRGGP